MMARDGFVKYWLFAMALALCSIGHWQGLGWGALSGIWHLQGLERRPYTSSERVCAKPFEVAAVGGRRRLV